MPKYQGSEFQSIIQAPTKGALDDLIGSAKEFAESNKMDDFKVLESGPDPDGGYRAIVTAHNWNPISWIRGKLSRKKKEEEEVTEEDSGDFRLTSDVEIRETPEEVEAREKKAEKEWLTEQERLDRIARVRTKYATRKAERLRKSADIGREEEYEAQIQAALKDYPPELREAAAKKFKEAHRARSRADIEIMESGIPKQIVTKQKVLQKEFWTDKETGKPIPEPRTAEERAKADYHPSQWTFIDVPRDLSPAERQSLARAIQFEEMELDIAREKHKQFKRERHPAVRVAKAAGGFGQFMAGAVTLGAAGVARGMQPGRGGPARAARMHAPGVPMELYRVRPMLGVGMPSSRDLTGSGLSHLREAVLPRIRRTKREVRQVRRDIE